LCRFRNADGQALVELALVIPVVLMIILGILDFGRAYNYQNNETSLANQALRYAEVNACSACNGQPIETYVKSTADSGELRSGGSGVGIQSPGVTISFCSPGPAVSSGQAGQPLQVTATATYRWLPYLIIGDSTISSTATGRIEAAYNQANPSANAYAQGGLAAC
jgi:hypothetical protein